MKTLGFTGTRQGMTDIQREQFIWLLKTKFKEPFEFVNGGCYGADEDSYVIVMVKTTNHITIHPSNIQGTQFDWEPGVRVGRVAVLDQKPPLERNWHIAGSDALAATPAGQQVKRSGTWATIRYASRQGRPIYIIYPDGQIMFSETGNLEMMVQERTVIDGGSR